MAKVILTGPKPDPAKRPYNTHLTFRTESGKDAVSLAVNGDPVEVSDALLEVIQGSALPDKYAVEVVAEAEAASGSGSSKSKPKTSTTTATAEGSSEGAGAKETSSSKSTSTTASSRASSGEGAGK